MPNYKRIKPTSADVRLMDPQSARPVPVDGVIVDFEAPSVATWWKRRERDGDASISPASAGEFEASRKSKKSKSYQPETLVAIDKRPAVTGKGDN